MSSVKEKVVPTVTLGAETSDMMMDEKQKLVQ